MTDRERGWKLVFYRDTFTFRNPLFGLHLILGFMGNWGLLIRWGRRKHPNFAYANEFLVGKPWGWYVKDGVYQWGMIV